MRKKLLSFVSLIVCIVVFLAACGGNGKNNTNSSDVTGSADSSNVTSGADSSNVTSGADSSNVTGGTSGTVILYNPNDKGAYGTNDTDSTSSTTGTSSTTDTSSITSINDFKSGQMTLSDFEKKYRPYTVSRINEIRNAKNNVQPIGGGTKYYVSNKGKAGNNGLTKNTPVPTYDYIKDKLENGDVVYFERGSEFRGSIKVNVGNFALAAYGEGKAPVFRLYNESAAGKGKWVKTDAPNVYKFYKSVENDVGTVVFDDTYYTYKSIYTADSVSKRYVNSYKDLKYDLQLYHDPSTKYVYVYCKKGNPGEVYNSVELAPGGAILTIYANNVTVDGLCFKNAGFGISAVATDWSETLEGLTVRNCEFGWIGGYVKNDTRLGNGIELWGGAVDFIVENNYFYQIYDAAATFQYSSTQVTCDAKVDNVQIINNVFEYCNYSVEYFMKTNGSNQVKDFVISGNLSWYAGDGMCSQRPDIETSAHIKSWSGSVRCVNKIKITNNLFALGLRQLCQTLDKTGLGAAYDNNVYVQREWKSMIVNSPASYYFKMDDNVRANIESQLGDKNAKIITIIR